MRHVIRMTKMRLFSKTVTVAVFLIGSASAFASQKLTPQECNDYPFVRVPGPVTNAQLERELSELESVGYESGPAADDLYPRTRPDLQQAEQLLHAKYVAECAPAAHMEGDHQTPGGS